MSRDSDTVGLVEKRGPKRIMNFLFYTVLITKRYIGNTYYVSSLKVSKLPVHEWGHFYGSLMITWSGRLPDRDLDM